MNGKGADLDQVAHIAGAASQADNVTTLVALPSTLIHRAVACSGIFNDALIAKNAQAPIRGDRTVMGRPRQALMRSHLARCWDDLTVDTSTQRHVVNRSMGQALKPLYPTHSRNNFPYPTSTQ